MTKKNVEKKQLKARERYVRELMTYRDQLNAKLDYEDLVNDLRSSVVRYGVVYATKRA